MEDFLEMFRDQFSDTDPALIKPETSYKELEEWSSLVSICLIAAIDDMYQVPIKASEILAKNTVSELYDLVKSKM